MIYTERKVSIKNDKATIDSPIILFRGDREVEIMFTIVDSKFKFESNKGNIIDKTQASFGQLAVALPDGTDLFTEIVECENGVVVFSITGEMIDEIHEVGFYSFHIRLYNDDKTSRITLPPVMEGIEIREPLIIEGDVENTDLVGDATVGHSMIQTYDADEEAFDEEGNYIPTVWGIGDKITAEKLNKVEDALCVIQDEAGNIPSLDTIEDNLQMMAARQYSSVTNPGALTSVESQESKYYTTHSYTLELIFSISNNTSLGWFYGGSMYLFGIRFDGKKISTSLNVKNYETSNAYPYQINELCQIVIVYNHTTTSKKAYVNGVSIGEATGDMSIGNLWKDQLVTTENVTINQKRIWRRALNDNEVFLLYNSGYPTRAVLSREMRNDLLSELIPMHITDDGWFDTVIGKNVAYGENYTLNTEDNNSVYEDVRNAVQLVEDNNSFYNNIIYPPFILEYSTRASHDCTFIDDYLFSFAKPSDGNSYVLQPDEQAKTLNPYKQFFVNFIEDNTRELEMKSADYAYDKLLVGNGRAIKYEEVTYEEQGARLYVFHEANTWANNEDKTEINFESCGKYDIIDVSELGYKIYGFWGNTENTVFVSCNLFNDVYKIKLGVGTITFDKGTFVENNNGYNGTYTILDHWHAATDAGSISGHGGQFYKGYLYIAPNDVDKCEVYRFNLKSTGVMTVDILSLHDINDKGKTLYHYIDGVCIKNDLMYVQPLCMHGSYESLNSIYLIVEL